MLHPRADVGAEAGNEDVAKVVMFQSTALPPDRAKRVTIGSANDKLGGFAAVRLANGEFRIGLPDCFFCLSGHRTRLRSVVPLRSLSSRLPLSLIVVGKARGRVSGL